MRKNLNSILLLVAILLLAYIAFLKPQSQRFATTPNFRIVLDTTTGRLCDARIPSKEAIKVAQLEIEKLEGLPADAEPDWFANIERKTALQKAKDQLYNLLHPSKYSLCSDLYP